MNKTYPIPEQIRNEIQCSRTTDLDLAKESAKYRVQLELLVSKIHSCEAQRKVVQGSMIKLIRDSMPEVGFNEFETNFETMKVRVITDLPRYSEFNPLPPTTEEL